MNFTSPIWLQEAGSAGKAVRLFYVTSNADGNDIMFVNTKLGAFADNVQYSTDNAETWEQLTDETVITLDQGQTVYFRNYTGQVYNLAMSTKVLKTSDVYSVGGDITALFYPRAKQLPTYAFKDAFAGDENLQDASDLILKSTSLAEYCYSSMFYGCTSLTAITCLANSGIESATINWLDSVSETGTFTKATGVEWPTGASGIPNGWTVIEQ